MNSIFSANFESNKSYWIGASDQKQETVFEWSDGQPFNYASKCNVMFHVNQNAAVDCSLL